MQDLSLFVRVAPALVDSQRSIDNRFWSYLCGLRPVRLIAKGHLKADLTLFARVALVLLDFKGHLDVDFDAICAGRARIVCLQKVA